MTDSEWDAKQIARAIEYLRASETSLDYENFDWGCFPTEADAPVIALARQMKDALQRLDTAIQAWWKAEPGLIPEAVQVVEADREAHAILDRLKARGGGDE